MNIRTRFCEALHDVYALLFPVNCAGCGFPDRSLCKECVAALELPVGVSFLDEKFAVFYALDYDGRVRAIIRALKSNHRTDVARFLAKPLIRALSRAHYEKNDPGSGKLSPINARIFLVPIPSSRRSFRARGYVPVKLVLTRARLHRSDFLRFRRQPEDQRHLSRHARAANVDGSMVSSHRLDGHKVLIVDDVLTTGATMREARRALVEAGAHVLGGAVIAQTPLNERSPRVK